MDATHCLITFVLPVPQAIVGASSDTKHLVAARSALHDPTGALVRWAAAGTNRSLPCGWAHISCASSSTPLAVTGIDLFKLTLSGGLPAALCVVQSLERLDLSGNQLRGPLPPCVTRFPTLVHLSLAGNTFSGHVPPSWGAGFRSLAALSLVQNALSGAFPAFLTNLTGLQELSLAYNPFAPSPLPEKLFDLDNLHVLFLTNCSLNGTPSGSSRISSIRPLDEQLVR